MIFANLPSLLDYLQTASSQKPKDRKTRNQAQSAQSLPSYFPLDSSSSLNTWDPSAIDPALFRSQSSSSELAGALTLPDSSSGAYYRPRPAQTSVSQPSSDGAASISANQSTNVAPNPATFYQDNAAGNPTQAADRQFHSQAPDSFSLQSLPETGAPSGSSESPMPTETTQPTTGVRACSVKGCKAAIPGS